MEPDQKGLLERMSRVAGDAAGKVQQEVAQPVVDAAKVKTRAGVRRAQQAALNQFPLATQDDVARLQAEIDRLEAALLDVQAQLAAKPAPRKRSTGDAKPKD
jgi:polyhydroxyalkanoate synthesis regulator phasin